MLDLAAFLTTPHLYVGAIVGLLGGLGAAWLVHWLFPHSAPTTLLALIVAAGCIAGLIIAAKLGSEKHQ